MHSRWAVALLLLLLPCSSSAINITLVPWCTNPTAPSQQPQRGIAMAVTAAEFYSSFASLFRLSDGSSISIPAQERTESLRYMQVGHPVQALLMSPTLSMGPQELLYAVGVYVDEAASAELARQNIDGDVLQICGKVLPF